MLANIKMVSSSANAFDPASSMLSQLARRHISNALTSSSRSPSSFICHRRAMMSAISGPPPRRPHEAGQRHNQQPLFQDSPPVVVPTGEAVSADASSPQVAARPPPVPKAQRPRPTIKSTKAALTVVRWLRFPVANHRSNLIFQNGVDTRSRIASPRSPQWSDSPTNTNWGAQQGVCWAFLPPRLRRQTWKV
jgi:hypothetical protein